MLCPNPVISGGFFDCDGGDISSVEKREGTVLVSPMVLKGI